MYRLGIYITQVHRKFIHILFHDYFVCTYKSGGAFTGVDFTGVDFADISGDKFSIVGFTFCLDTLTTIILVCFMLPSPIICP